MKITDVKVWLVRGIKYNWTLLKISTAARSFSKPPSMSDNASSASTR